MADIRFALRQLARAPGYVAVALLTLTLGMGANTAFFSVLYGVVLKEPPYPAAERLMTLHNRYAGAVGNEGRLSRAELQDYRERQRAFESIAASDLGRMTLTSKGGSETVAERVKVSRVTPNLFALLGVAPVKGRGIGEKEETAVAVVSHELWQAQLGGTDDVLGRTIRLGGVEYAIVGVMPRGFGYPESDMGAWLPLDLTSRGASDREDHYLFAIGRLAPGMTKAQAQQDLDRVATALKKDMPSAYPQDKDARWSLGTQSLRDAQFGRMLLPLGLLMAAAASVLLIACVNVAIMSLLRAITRRREISIRLALGATKKAIVKQLAAEAAVLSVLGAAGGLLVADVGLDLLKAFAPADIPRLSEVALNLPTALFTSAVLVLVTLLVGLAPSVVAMKIGDPRIPTGRGSDTRSTTRLRDALTVMEISLAASLLVCAGLTLRSQHALVNVDLGFATEHRFSFKTNLTEREYPDAAKSERFYSALTQKLEALPGVVSIGGISYLPLSNEGQTTPVAPADRASEAPDLTVGRGIVRGRYFETMGVTLLRGRFFSTEDGPKAPPVVIVDDVLARRLWQSEDAIGRPLRFGAGGNAQTRTVVGVVRKVTHFGPGKDSLPMAYAPQSQIYQRGMYTVIRTTGPPQALLTAAKEALAQVDPEVPLYFAETVDARYDQALSLPRFTAGLVTAFSTLALVLAGVGIFGVTGYAVAQRTREFAIRFALGAQRTNVGTLVLSKVAVLTLIGLAAGTSLGLALGSLMSGILFGVKPADPVTLAAVMAAIAATAMLASLAPLRHAVRVSPAETLRSE